MMTFLTIIHIIVCLLLIALVLLQDPKSSGGGIFGGGGANSLLGATGSVTFLTKLTRYSAIVFGITCIALALLMKGKSESVIDQLPAAAAPVQQTPPASGSESAKGIGTESPAGVEPSAVNPQSPQPSSAAPAAAPQSENK